MSMDYIPVLDIFMAVLGFGFSIIFCTALCRACHRFREERSADRRREDGRPPSVYVIPFPSAQTLSESGEDRGTPPQYSQELHRFPQYNPAVFSGQPPSYDELGFKPDDVPPAYSEFVNVPFYSITPPPAH